MKLVNSYLKVNIICQVILVLFLLIFLFNESYAKANCSLEVAQRNQGLPSPQIMVEVSQLVTQ